MVSVPEAMPQVPVRRYSNVTVAFHWATVALVISQAILGFWFHNMDRGPARTEVFTWHKTVGAVILLVTLARLFYRLNNPPPPFTPEIPNWERIAAVWNHRLFYFLLIAMPLSGLTAVSARTEGLTTDLAFGIPLPVIPGVSESAGELAGDVHVILVYVLLAAIAVHAAAALKQQFYNRWRLSGRMPPFQVPGDEEAVVGQGSDARPIEDGAKAV